MVNGAGAAAVSCAKLYIALGVKPENVIMCDSKGVISVRRQNLNAAKAKFATTREVDTLEEALVGADVFLGLSVADVLTQEMVRSMADNPIVFALANPNPEISYDNAMAAREDIIFATGRSDYPNQVNNVLGFPYIFRGAPRRARHQDQRGDEDRRRAGMAALTKGAGARHRSGRLQRQQYFVRTRIPDPQGPRPAADLHHLGRRGQKRLSNRASRAKRSPTGKRTLPNWTAVWGATTN